VSETDRTDIIQDLRPSDTPPLGLPFVEGQHLAHRSGLSRIALFTAWAAPVAIAALLVGRFVLPGLFFDGKPAGPVQVSPSPTATEPSSLEPTAPLPVRSQSRADRSRPRATRPPATVSPTAKPRRSSRPTPAPTRSSPRESSPSPSPTRPGSSSTPTPTHTVTLIPTPEATDG
jgi:hypothetical protein